MNEPGQTNRDVRRILRERASQLARLPKEETDEETIDVVVIGLESGLFGIETAYVSEVQPLGPLTPIPGIMSLWAGLVNLRGHMVPVLDLGAALGFNPFFLVKKSGSEISVPGKKTSNQPAKDSEMPAGQIVLVSSAALQIGLLVEKVIEIRQIPLNTIGQSPGKLTAANNQWITGMTSDLLSILDMQTLLADPRLVVQDEVA